MVVTGLDLLRVWSGPLPLEFCQFCLLLKGTICYAVPCNVAGVVTLKFFYICVWRRFKPIDDDFVARIIIIISCFLGFLMQLTKILAPGKPVYNIVFCTGVYKPSFDAMDKKIPIEMGMLLPILISQILTPIIHWQKKKLSLANLLHIAFKSANQNTPDYESLALYFVTNICFILCVVFVGLCNR